MICLPDLFPFEPKGNLVDWNHTKVPIKKDRKTTARRKKNRLARKQRKLNGSK